MFKVWVNGVAIECETVEAAVELARYAGVDGAPAIRSTTAPVPDGGGGGAMSRWTEKRVTDFLSQIKTTQRKLVDALLETDDARTDEQLCKLLNLTDNRALAGVFAGLYKNAKKVGANPKEVYRRHSVTIGDRRQFEYTLTPTFREAVRKWRT